MSKNKKENENNDIKINLEESSVAKFTKRPLPSESEVAEFEEMVGEVNESEGEFIDPQQPEKEEEIKESLNEIYQDDDGKVVDVKKIEVKKRRGLVYWTLMFIVFVGLAGGGIYVFYNYFFINGGTDATALDFSIEGPSEVTAGEEFFYNLTYKNLSNVVITNARLEITYPDNFIYLDSYPTSKHEENRAWDIFSIPAQSLNTVKIKGMMVGHEDEVGIVLAKISYTPVNFSSEFKKETSLTTAIRDIGLEIDIDYIPTALVREKHDVSIHFNAKDNNYISDFRITMEPNENIEIVDFVGDEEDAGQAAFTIPRPGVWLLEGVNTEDQFIPFQFIVKDKISDTEEIVLLFEKPTSENEYRTFLQETLSLEVLKSDLNLTLIINGSREDQGVDFGDTLHYSIVYNNKGETDLNNVIIMAVLESNFLDFSTLDDANKGEEKGHTITWSKTEIPELEVVEKHEEGTIDFSVQIVGAGQTDEGQEYQVKSYAHYNVGKAPDDETDEVVETSHGASESDNKSNTIINRINSDLKLTEAVRYFSEDNIPVGTGPHPPKAGETSSYKVYWEIKNNLHELNDLVVSVILPDYVEWNEKERATLGDVSYNNSLHAIVWDIGRLPITVFAASAEFSIKVTPIEDDKNKIMVLLPGSKAIATDAETNDEINKTSKAQTTKLDDDEIGRGDGIVE